MRVRTVLAVLLVALTSCNTYMDGYPCTNPDKGHLDALNNPDPCHENDPDAGTPSADAGETCDGVCLPSHPSGWDGPYLLWTGAEADAPHCSDLPGNPDEIYTGHGDLDAPTHCDACACAPPTGSCELPATVTASAGICPGGGPGVPQTPFDPPPKWDGTCTSANAIPLGKLCGGMPCVQSVTIAPLTLKDNGCLPIQPPNVQPSPVWKKFARACSNGKVSYCETGSRCVPVASPTQFKQCISHDGETGLSECPPEYPESSVFYKSFTDDRSCPECACGAPNGSTCSGSLGLFSDGACGAPVVGPIISLDAKGPKCVDVPQGSALGSKSASQPSFTGGQCAPQSDDKTTVFISPQDAIVWCCQGTP